MDELINLFIY